MPDHILRDEVTIFSQTKWLRTVRDFVTRNIQQSRVAENERGKVILAVDEAIANIIEHGYGSRDDGVIHIIIEVTEESFQITIQDHGVSFDPNLKSDELDIQSHVAAGKRRGLGIFLMRRIMDEVTYHFKEGVRNELVLVKYTKKP
ncbi:MAG: ATP-binding protein [Planctomycetota bacterium]